MELTVGADAGLMREDPAVTRGWPRPPMDVAGRRSWRQQARAEASRLFAEEPVMEWAVQRLRLLAAGVPQPLGERTARSSTLFGEQTKWRSTEYNRFVPAEINEVAQHMAMAEALEPAGLLGAEANLAPSVVAAIEKVANLRETTASWRAAQLRQWTEVAEALRPVTDKLYRRMVPQHLACAHRERIHLALFEAAVRALDWPDAFLACDLVVGLPPWGEMEPTNLSGWRMRSEAEAPRLEAGPSASERRAWNEWVQQSVQNGPPDDAARRACWLKTVEELDGGLIDGPFTFEELQALLGEDRWLAMRRFPVEQKGEFRPCDHGSEGYTNEWCRVPESMECITADWPARVAQHFVEVLGDWAGWSLLLATDDIFKAYRFVPCDDPGATVFVIRDPGGVAKFFTMPGFNFGLRAAPAGFNRVPELGAECARRFCACVTDHYYDDFPTCEPGFAGDSGQRALTQVMQSLGFPLASKKSFPPATVRTFLGVVSDFTSFAADGVVEMYVTAERSQRLVDEMSQILRADRVTPGQAASLAGSLVFVTAWAFNRYGKAALQPIVACAAAGGRGYARPVSSALAMALRFLCALLPVLPRKRFRLRSVMRPTVKIWTDAMWEPSQESPAGLGVVLWLPPERSQTSRWKDGRYLHAALSVPVDFMDRFVTREQYIGQLELLAAVAAYTTFAEEVRGRRVIHWIDNTGALAALIKGYGRAPDSAYIVHAFQALNVGLETDVWFEWVASKANIADLPSRGEFDELVARGSCARPMLLPAVDDWFAAAEVWIRRGATRGHEAGWQSRRRRPLPPGVELGDPRMRGKRNRRPRASRVAGSARE